MPRIVRIATCQPPAPRDGIDADAIERRALELLAHAAEQRADIACLPECLNIIGCDPDQARTRIADAHQLVERVADTCAGCHMYAVLPIVERRADALFNTAIIVGRDGQTVGRYDKVHITNDERYNWGMTPGNDYPVFDLDFGRVGVMICYDGCFVEPARILALEGTEVVFFPSLQRSYTEDQLALQVRSRAADNFLYVVRSSFGTERSEVWRPGAMVGKSCIAAPDGTIIADLGKNVGVTVSTIDLDLPLLGLRSYAGDTGVAKEMRFADRRPETYGRLARGASCT